VPPVAGRGVGTKEKGEADSRSSRLRLESRRSFALGAAVPSTPGVRVCDRVVRMAYLRLFE
jgi:hypothetical protein